MPHRIFDAESDRLKRAVSVVCLIERFGLGFIYGARIAVFDFTEDCAQKDKQ